MFELDVPGYQYALISGPDTDYFWLLSRTPQMQPALRDRLLDIAVDKGFKREQIILVDQSEAAD